MNISKSIAIGLLVVGISTLSSCKKEDMSKYATKEDLNNYATNSDLANSGAKTFNFSLTFGAGDTFKSYSGITGYDAGDVLLTFVHYDTYGGTPYWVQTPVIVNNFVNVFTEFETTSGHLFVNTLKADGTSGSPWTSSSTFSFKAVLIKSTGLIQNPNVDLTNYEAVKEAFNLVD